MNENKRSISVENLYLFVGSCHYVHKNSPNPGSKKLTNICLNTTHGLARLDYNKYTPCTFRIYTIIYFFSLTFYTVSARVQVEKGSAVNPRSSFSGGQFQIQIMCQSEGANRENDVQIT